MTTSSSRSDLDSAPAQTHPQPGGQRAAIYCRVSSPGQKENGSLEEQEERARAYCAERHYVVDDALVYHEVYSGEDIARPQLELLSEAMKEGRVDVVVADKVDRFSRADPAITAYVMVEAEQYGAKVEFVEVRDDSFEGQILSAVLSIVARVEHKRIRERTTAGKRRRVLGDPTKGKPQRLMPGNVPRYGWQYTNELKDAYVLEPHQASVIERIYRELGEQGRPLNRICHDLEQEGEPPPTEALRRMGYHVGKRKSSMRWHPSSIARMLKEPCYWGEAVAYRYEAFEKAARDPQTNRIRRRKRTRYRALDDAAIVRYPPEVWPPIITKELALKALARLHQNQVEAERNLKNTHESFLRAGLIKCGYCGANMVLHAHAPAKGEPSVLRFVCGRHRAYKAMREHADTDCSAGGQFSLRVDFTEAAVWSEIASCLMDRERVPAAYAALIEQEERWREQHAVRLRTLDSLIADAEQKRARLAATVGETDDPDVRRLLAKQMEEHSAHLRTWRHEHAQVVAEVEEARAQVAEVRQTVDEIFERWRELGDMPTAKRRQVAEALGVQVYAHRHTHQPWFELVSDLPSLAASWHAATVQQAAVEQGIEDIVERYRSRPPSERDLMAGRTNRLPRTLIPMSDLDAQVRQTMRESRVPDADMPKEIKKFREYRAAIHKWTAPVPVREQDGDVAEAGVASTREHAEIR